MHGQFVDGWISGAVKFFFLIKKAKKCPLVREDSDLDIIFWIFKGNLPEFCM